MNTKETELPHGVGVIIMHTFAAPGIWMSQRSPNAARFPNYWQIPGGKVEPGEDAETAAIREVEEETGGMVLKPHMLWEVCDGVFDYADGTQYRSTNFVYFDTGYSGLPFVNTEPTKQTDYVCVLPMMMQDADSLIGMDVMPSTLRALIEAPNIRVTAGWLKAAAKAPEAMQQVKALSKLTGYHVWSEVPEFAVIRSALLREAREVEGRIDRLLLDLEKRKVRLTAMREFLTK